MHASLAVSFSYARHLTGAPRRTLQECYHSSQALSLFQRRLRRPVVPDRDGDPIWGTAAALVILAYLSAETTASWPLADATAAGPDGSDPCQLTWLTMSRGKSALQNLAKPFRPKSIFRIMGPTFADMHRTLPESGVAAIPPDLAAVCGLDESSTAESSPYFRLAHALSLILPLRDVDVTYGLTEVFVRSIDATVEANLRAKDPTTLLLLYLWYAKAGRCNWWVRLRSRVEGPPIKTFLLGLREGAKYAPFLDDEWLAKVERDDSDAQGDKPLALRRILAPPPSVVEGSR